MRDEMKWHRRFLDLAVFLSQWSKHPDYRVGAVAIGEYGQILATGYNGWPRGISGEEVGYEQTECGNPSLTIHAEANVIYNASLTGVSLRGSTVYIHPVFPCVECAKALVQVGVRRICYEETASMAEQVEKWGKSWLWARHLFTEARITVIKVNGK